MEWFILNLIGAILQTWFITYLLDIKNNIYWFSRILMVVINMIVVTMYVLFDFYDVSLSLILFVLNFVLGCLLSYNKKSEILFVVILERVYSLTMFVLLLSINEILRIQLPDYTSKIFYLFFGLLFLKPLKKMRYSFHKMNDYILIVVLFGLYCLCTRVMQEYLVWKMSGNDFIQMYGKMYSILISCLLSVFLLLFYLFDLNNKKEKYEKLKQQQKNEQALLHIYEQLKITKHDLKHDYQLIDYYLNQKDYVKLKELVNNHQEMMTSVPTLIQTRNELINTIINNKIINADMKHIKVECQLNIPYQLSIPDYLLNDLLSNILDNAIENCPKDGMIKISIIYQNQLLHIKVENSIDETFSKELKTKKNKKYHCYGLKSIYRIVEQYDGQVNTEYNDKQFGIYVTLFIK